MSGPGLDTLKMQASLESKLFGLSPPALTVGRFTVLERLGHGGMGVVYSVYDETLDRRVALKVLRGGSTGPLRQRLQREAKAMARLSHPNVVPVFEVGEHEEQLFIVMEYVAGQTLGAWQRAEPRTLAGVLDKYAQAGRGLGAAHAEGIIHRDFKPDNAIVRASGRVQVLDFGLARRSDGAPSLDADRPALGTSDVADRSGTPLTETGSLVGTPAYMAPEQFDGGLVDERSDQFAFCISLWEALCGQRPFEGESVPALSSNVASGTLRRPPADARMTSVVQRVLERGLAPDPGERWPSMDALLRALEPRRSTSARWLALGGVGVALAAGGVALLRAPSESEPSPCVDGPAQLATAWTPERRADVERELSGFDSPTAASVASRVLTQLDAYAKTWRDAYDDACGAAMVERSQSLEVRDQRYRCLDERKRRLDALLHVLEDPTQRTFDNAATTTAGLPSIERCADLDYVALEEPPPEDPAEAAAWAELLDDLALAQALRTAGKYEESLALAQGHLDGSTTRSSSSGVLRSANEVAATLLDLARLDEAMDAAAEGFVVGELGTRHEVIRNLLLVGAVHNHNGDYDEALLFRRKALQMGREAYGEQDVSVGRIHGFIGDSFQWQNRFEEALVHYERSYDVLKETLPENTHEMAQIHAQLGGALQGLGRFEEGLEHLETSLKIREEVLGKDHPYVASTKIRIGLAYGGSGDHEEALRWYQGALDIYGALDMLGHPEVGSAHLNTGFSYEKLKRYSDARTSYERAKAIFTVTDGPNHPYTAVANANLGEVSALEGKYDEALEHYAVALRARRTKMGQTAPKVGDTLADMAAVAAEGGRHEDAVGWATEALEIHVAATGEHNAAVQSDLERLAASHQALGHQADAKRNRDRALAVKRALEAEPEGG